MKNTIIILYVYFNLWLCSWMFPFEVQCSWSFYSMILIGLILLFKLDDSISWRPYDQIRLCKIKIMIENLCINNAFTSLKIWFYFFIINNYKISSNLVISDLAVYIELEIAPIQFWNNLKIAFSKICTNFLYYDIMRTWSYLFFTRFSKDNDETKI